MTFGGGVSTKANTRADRRAALRGKPIRVRDEHVALPEAITFLVKNGERSNNLATGAWYVSWIVYGLRDHGVPEEYIQHVVEVAIATNGRATVGWAGEQSRIIGEL
jgi:hypothetical protein